MTPAPVRTHLLIAVRSSPSPPSVLMPDESNSPRPPEWWWGTGEEGQTEYEEPYEWRKASDENNDFFDHRRKSVIGSIRGERWNRSIHQFGHVVGNVIGHKTSMSVIFHRMENRHRIINLFWIRFPVLSAQNTGEKLHGLFLRNHVPQKQFSRYPG